MFGKKAREETRLLKATRATVDHQARRLGEIEAALNDLTELIAKKHRLKLHQPMFYPLYGYARIQRFETRTTTTHVKDE